MYCRFTDMYHMNTRGSSIHEVHLWLFLTRFDQLDSRVAMSSSVWERRIYVVVISPYHSTRTWKARFIKVTCHLCLWTGQTVFRRCSSLVSLGILSASINPKLTRIVCIRPKGRTQCIFPCSQHSCLYVYIYIDQKWIYIKL